MVSTAFLLFGCYYATTGLLRIVVTDLPPINWASEKVRILAESLVREKEVLP